MKVKIKVKENVIEFIDNGLTLTADDLKELEAIMLLPYETSCHGINEFVTEIEVGEMGDSTK